MRTINEVLDTARERQNVRSDYKLALVTGIREAAISNYRHGRNLPDEKSCAKLAAAIGEKPDVLVAEMQAQRSKDPEARKIWEGIALRLQAGFANLSLLLSIAIVCVAFASPAVRAATVDAVGEISSLCIMFSAICRLFWRLFRTSLGMGLRKCNFV